MARTVLLADDSVTAQNMGRRILMDAGYEVVTVNNGSAALKRIHESKPDLIVLDVYMPGYGGLEVCQRLKESGETMKIPVLLTVGKMEPFKAEEAKRVRADGHIVKPFEASELLAALTRLEDRIVPQAESPAVRRGKPENKTRLWHAEDPLAEFAHVPTEQITYLAEVKKRQLHSEPAAEPAPLVHQESSSAAAAAAQAASAGELATASALLGPSSAGAPPAPPAEFTVQESAIPSPVDGQDESAPTEFQAADPVAELPGSGDASALEEAAKASVPVASAEPPAVPADMASGPVSAPRWVAENVPLTAEEASIALEAEMQQAQAVSSATIESETLAHAESSSSHTAAAQMPPEPGTENPSEVSFAAAASAVVSSQQSAVIPHPISAREQDTVPVPESEPQIPSEAAAAWENWRQIRESVMSPQKAAAIAGSVAEMAQAVGSAEDSCSKQDPAPSEGAGASIAAVEEDNSIASIVDSVLADLKPRLMEEIAKKLAAKKS